MNCGLDAYLYLYFQRQMMKLIGTIFTLSIVTSFGFNLYIAYLGDFVDYNDFFTKVLMGNKDLITNNPSMIYAILSVIISFFTLKTVFRMKAEAKRVFSLTQKQASLVGSKSQSNSPQKNGQNEDRVLAENIEWLKQRTIHVKGLLPNDRKGELLERMIGNHLVHSSGKILGLIIVPNY